MMVTVPSFVPEILETHGETVANLSPTHKMSRISASAADTTAPAMTALQLTLDCALSLPASSDTCATDASGAEEYACIDFPLCPMY